MMSQSKEIIKGGILEKYREGGISEMKDDSGRYHSVSNKLI